MSSEIKVSSVKAKDGTAGISIADSTGRVTFSDNNPVITLGSNTTGLVSGTEGFSARFTVSNWDSIADGAIVPFNNDSTGDSFDTGNNFDTSTYKYTIPATGVYLFYYGIYTAENDTSNAFGFETNNGEINNQHDGGNFFTQKSGDLDHIQTDMVIMHFTSGQTIWTSARTQSDYYSGHSYWGGCRLK